MSHQVLWLETPPAYPPQSRLQVLWEGYLILSWLPFYDLDEFKAEALLYCTWQPYSLIQSGLLYSFEGASRINANKVDFSLAALEASKLHDWSAPHGQISNTSLASSTFPEPSRLPSDLEQHAQTAMPTNLREEVISCPIT